VSKEPCNDESNFEILPRTNNITTAATTVPINSFANAGVGQATSRLGIARPTVWTEFGKIANSRENLANLGQGFPDWSPPKFALDSLLAASTVDPAIHQYTRPAGHPHLVQQLARRYSLHLRRAIDGFQNVAVTVGASQALFLSLQTIISPGDEVILFEPFFDLYVNQVKLAGGIPVYVPLEFRPYSNDGTGGGEWTLNPQTLRNAVNSNTKAIILNSPHNPTGKIFTRSEMELIAESLDLAHPDCIVLSDEVYKYIVHSEPKEGSADDRNTDTASNSLFCRGHVHFASLPGMWDKTITISSAGKTFSATGWQVGWCIGPQHLISRIHQLLPYVQFCASTVMQEALARTLQLADQPYNDHPSYYDYLRAKYTRKRDLLAQALRDAGFGIPNYDITPGGGFFILARVGDELRSRIPPHRLNVPNPAAPAGIARADWSLCQWMAEEKGILCIPSSPFFSEASARSGISDEFVRIAFCKTDETIQAASNALRKLKKEMEDAASSEATEITKEQNIHRR
jgi:kynurenine--oxoglutarate transaminase/cysteine-S-conjugate beta-lyase/glutamine--phenylpyruvate transaminase